MGITNSNKVIDTGEAAAIVAAAVALALLIALVPSCQSQF